MNLIQRIRAALRGHPIYGPGTASALRRDPFLALGSTARDWQREAGDLHASTIVAIGLGWIARKASQTRLQVVQDRIEGLKPATLPDGERMAAWRAPNDHQGEEHIVMAALAAIVCTGNAYLVARRDLASRLIGFWAVWPRQMRPLADVNMDGTTPNGERLVTRWEYTPIGGAPRYIAPEDVCHLRWPMPDPYTPVLGLSPLSALLRQVATHNEAATFEASVLKQMGWPGVIMVPKGDLTDPPTEQQRRLLRQLWQQFTGDRRGEALAMPGPVEIVQPTWSPRDMQLDAIKNLAAQEICAALGFDPMALHLPSENKTYSNFAEAREDAIESGLLPLLSIVERGVTAYLRREGVIPSAPKIRLAFDLSVYRELAEDEDKATARIRENFKAGITSRGEARSALGYTTETDDSRTWFDLRPAGAAPVNGAMAARLSARARSRAAEVRNAPEA